MCRQKPIFCPYGLFSQKGLSSAGGPKLLKWGLSGQGSNLLKSGRPLTPRTPGSRVHTPRTRVRRGRSACELWSAPRRYSIPNTATLINKNRIANSLSTTLSRKVYRTLRPENYDCACVLRARHRPPPRAPSRSEAWARISSHSVTGGNTAAIPSTCAGPLSLTSLSLCAGSG